MGSLSESGKEQFDMLLEEMGSKITSLLPAEAAIDFFTAVTENLDDASAFEMKIASSFAKNPEQLPKAAGAIKSAAQLRVLMSEDNDAAEILRQLTYEFFNARISELSQQMDFASYDAEKSGYEEAQKKRDDEESDLKKQISTLEQQYQILYEEEKEERRQRKQEKKEQESHLKEVLQFEHDASVIERRMRQTKIKQQISELSERLQAQHEQSIRAQKVMRLRKKAKIKMQAERQVEERTKQAEIRRQQKEKEQTMMEMRQKKILAQQRKQSEERAAKKQKKSYDSYLADNLYDGDDN